MGWWSSTPSRRTRVCSELAPRRKTDEAPPMPPFWATETAGASRRASRTNGFLKRLRSKPETNEVALPTSRAGVTRRVAVTTTSWCSEAACGLSFCPSSEWRKGEAQKRARAKEERSLFLAHSLFLL